MKNVFLLVLILCMSALAAPAIGPEKLLILIVGPSSTTIHPTESGVVERLNQLRAESNLYQLQMGTMHFDQPQEAKFCRQVLGIQEQDLVAVSLVELDSQGQMARSLYTVPKVTPQAIDQAQKEVLTQWSELSGVATRTVGEIRPPSTPASKYFREPREVYTPEGVLNLARQTEAEAARLWAELRNAPLRSDGQDKQVRVALAALPDRAGNLKVALEEGLSNPKNRFVELFQGRQQFHEAEPQYFLPVPMRRSYSTLDDLIDRLQEAYTQLNR